MARKTREIVLTADQVTVLVEGLSRLHQHLSNVKQALQNHVGYNIGVPKNLGELDNALDALKTELHKAAAAESGATFPPVHARAVATVVIRHRREFITDLERNRKNAITKELLKGVGARQRILDDLLTAPWYARAKPIRVPRLRDFVAPKQEPAFAKRVTEPVRDDKFGILLSASGILNDLHSMRSECEDRSTPLTVAFVDVDGLKPLNSKLGETSVDSLILPPIMRAVEQVAFGHGQAYRYGGDEFVILMPSSDQDVARVVLGRLRKVLATLEYEVRLPRPTVSIGLCVIEPDSPLTDSEVVHWAAMAKRRAKAAGPNSVAVCIASVRVTRPESPSIDVLRESAVRLVG